MSARYYVRQNPNGSDWWVMDRGPTAISHPRAASDGHTEDEARAEADRLNGLA